MAGTFLPASNGGGGRARERASVGKMRQGRERAGAGGARKGAGGVGRRRGRGSRRACVLVNGGSWGRRS
jgi:hypothetical protein